MSTDPGMPHHVWMLRSNTGKLSFHTAEPKPTVAGAKVVCYYVQPEPGRASATAEKVTPKKFAFDDGGPGKDETLLDRQAGRIATGLASAPGIHEPIATVARFCYRLSAGLVAEKRWIEAGGMLVAEKNSEPEEVAK